MAYFGKLGALSRQMVATSMLQKSGAAAAAALPAVYMLQRGMASSKLFIGGLCRSPFFFPLLSVFSAGCICRNSLQNWLLKVSK
jgi:hypothetical protein